MFRYVFYIVYVIVLLMVVYVSGIGMILSGLAGPVGSLVIAGGLLVASLIFYVGSYKYVFNACDYCNE